MKDLKARYNLNNFKTPSACPTGKSLYLEFVAAGHLELVFEGGNAGRMKRFYDEFKTRHEKFTAAPMPAVSESSVQGESSSEPDLVADHSGQCRWSGATGGLHAHEAAAGSCE